MKEAIPNHDVQQILRQLDEMRRTRCTPEAITCLEQDEVLVFGTDPAGEHRSSAAKLAVEKFGAKPGLSFGFSGQSFAIPVHKFKWEKMAAAVSDFVQFAHDNPQLKFYVLSIGCGAAGMEPDFVAIMFRKVVDLTNVWLSKSFIEALISFYTKDSGYNIRISKEDLIIGRHWVFIRKADGRMKFVCGEAPDDLILEVSSWKNVVCAAAGFHEVFAVLASGDVVCASSETKRLSEKLRSVPYRQFSIQSAFDEGYLEWYERPTHWRGVQSIVACEGRVAGLMHDGRILSLSNQSGYEKPEDYDRKLEQLGKLGNVKRLSVSWLHAAVLDDSGRVSVVGVGDYCNAGKVSNWREVIDIDVFGCYYSPIQTVGLRSDGRVLHTLDCPEIDMWRDVSMVSCLGSSSVVALDKDGNVLFAGNDRLSALREKLSKWPRMAVVRGNFNTVAGVDSEGRIWIATR